MNAVIINIGDELLIGQTVNTNASWMGMQLNAKGVRVNNVLVIPDNPANILQAMQDYSDMDVVLITGGLGPTRDDITKQTFSEFFGVGLVENPEVLQDVTEYFKKRGRTMNALNRAQALVPEGCRVIRNRNGTAPGMWMTKGKTHFISLPGVPYEMQAMMTDEILPFLESERKRRYGEQGIYHHTLVTIGIGESVLAEKIREWEEQVRKEGLSLAYLPQPGMVRLRLSGYEADDSVRSTIRERIKTLRTFLCDDVLGEEFPGDEPLTIQRVLVDLCIGKQLTLGMAESCTGGYASSLVTSVPGCSEIFKGSVVGYSNEVKMRLLGVSQHILHSEGAVSEACVKEMCRGCIEHLNTDLGLAFSGVAGPGGGTREKPVGTVWVAWGNRSVIHSKMLMLGEHRQRNIHLAAVYGLNFLRKFIQETGSRF